MPDISPATLLCGLETPLSPIPLRAGPLSLEFGDGDLRYLRCGGREVVRRIYVGVRAPGWATVPGRLRDLSVQDGGDSFRLRFTVGHLEGDVHFEWQGEIDGTPDGAVTFRMKGKALSTFLRSRIGICVLHPIDECSGKPCEIVHPDGTIEAGEFPELIAPHQPFKQVREIRYDPAPGLRARIAFSGDVFETEDQRNWTDVSFKTYSTPLDLPIPVEVRAGTPVEQSVEVCLAGAVPTAPEPGREPTFALLSAQVPLPRIGLLASAPETRLDPVAVARLRLLRLSHLRVDLHLPDDRLDERLDAASAEAESLGAALQIALYLPPPGNVTIERALSSVSTCRARVESVLVFDQRGLPAGPEEIARVRQLLAVLRPVPAIGSGAAGNFADLNRNRPVREDVDFYCYSANPQVHTADNPTIVENLRGLGWTVRTAGSFAGDRPLVIGPVSLRSRRKPESRVPNAGGGLMNLPEGADLRQVSLFGAGWTACGLGYLAAENVRSVTLFETSGWAGVLQALQAAPGMDSVGIVPGTVFPLYHVLADLAEFTGGRVIRAQSSDALSFDGVAITDGTRTCVILASWRPVAQRVRIEGCGRDAAVRRLNGDSISLAMNDPAEFRARPARELACEGSVLKVDLGPFEVARVDWRVE